MRENSPLKEIIKQIPNLDPNETVALKEILQILIKIL